MATILISSEDKSLNDIGYFSGTKVLGIFDGMSIFRHVYQMLTDVGHRVILDYRDHSVDTIMFIEPPTKNTFQGLRKEFPAAKLVCVLMESPAIVKIDWDYLLSEMDVLLSWNTQIQSSKHQYLPYPAADYFSPGSVPEAMKAKERNFSMFAGNKFSFRKNELYSKRRKIVRFFAKSGSEDFDLFGPKWDQFHFFGLPYTNRLAASFRVRPPKPYVSVVNDKIAALGKFKFCFALENFRGSQGYVTEKIHDCFRAGTVPIYSGYSGIDKLIPSETAIYLDDFSSIAGCVDFCRNMSIQHYTEMLNNICEFTKQNSESEISTATKIVNYV